MFTELLAQKTRLAMMTVVATIAGCTVICGFTVWYCISLVNKERQQIYILDGDIPSLAKRAQLGASFAMEAKAHIQLFHQHFFSLLLDNDCIKQTLGKVIHMTDDTALKQKQALDENDFYPGTISSSAVCITMCDSVLLDEHERKFTYYDTQFIRRRAKDLKRSMVTTGYIGNVPETRNNLHGLMTTNWRTIENGDLDY